MCQSKPKFNNWCQKQEFISNIRCIYGSTKDELQRKLPNLWVERSVWEEAYKDWWLKDPLILYYWEDKSYIRKEQRKDLFELL